MMAGWGTGGFIQRANPSAGAQDLSRSMIRQNVGVNSAGGLSTVPGHIQPAVNSPNYNPLNPNASIPAPTDPNAQMNRGATTPPPVAPPASTTPPPPGPGAGTADQFVTPSNLLDANQPWHSVYQSLSGSGIPEWQQYQPNAPTGEQNITQWMQGGQADPLFAAAVRARAFGNNNPYLAALIQKQGGLENANATINHYLAGGGSGYAPDSPMAFGWKYQNGQWVPPAGDTSGLTWDPVSQTFKAGAGFNAFSGGLPAYGTPGAVNTGTPTNGPAGTPTTVTTPSAAQTWLGNWWDHPDTTPVNYVDPITGQPVNSVKTDKSGKPLATTQG